VREDAKGFIGPGRMGRSAGVEEKGLRKGPVDGGGDVKFVYRDRR